MRSAILALAIGSSTVARAQDAPTGRLPATTTPMAYRLDIREDPAQLRFIGHVEIDVRLSASTRRIWINGRDLDVSRVIVRTGGRTVSATYTQVAGTGVARVDLASPVAAGPATLVFDYARDFRDGSSGLYRLQAGGRWYSYTQFQPIEARTAFPSFDEPGFKTPYTITLTLPAGLTAVSNAPEVSAETMPDGWITHRFAPTLPLPSYLVAFMAGPFATAAGTLPATPSRPTPLPVRIVATAPQADRLAFALKETGPILSLLEAYFGDAFPFPKLDQIATPAWQGETAMENAGADTYADRVLLLGRNASIAQQRAFGMVVAHELSHQWFGDLVTPAWWDDIWLNESFANWMGYRIGNAWRPDLGIGNGAVVDALRAMDLDALSTGRPIRQPIASAEDADSAFDEVTYSKGGQVVTQTAAYLGDEAFRAGVRLHLSRHRYGSATSDQFFAALSDAAHDPRITVSMKSFVDQQGVPLMTFARGSLGWSVTQSRYTLLGQRASAQTWVAPLCMRPVAGKRTCVLVDRKTTALSGLDAGPFVPNADGTGYYRFELPDADWRALIATLGTLPAAEALAINDSLWASFAAGRASPDLLVEAARRIAQNPDGAAALDGAVRLRAWRVRGLIGADELPAYRRMMAALYGATLSALRLDLRAGAYADEDPGRRASREDVAAVIAEEARDPGTRAALAAAAARYLGGDKAALDDGFLPLALTIYLEEQDLATAERLLKRAETSDDAVFKIAAITAVGAGAPVRTAADVIALVFEPKLAIRTRSGLAGALLGRSDTRAVARAAVVPRLADLGRYIPGLSSFGGTGSFDQACSAGEATAIEAALRPYVADIRGGALEVDRMVERVASCGVLATQRSKEIAEALE